MTKAFLHWFCCAGASEELLPNFYLPPDVKAAADLKLCGTSLFIKLVAFSQNPFVREILQVPPVLFQLLLADLKLFCMNSQLAPPVPKQLVSGGSAVKLNRISFAVAFAALPLASFVAQLRAGVSSALVRRC